KAVTQEIKWGKHISKNKIPGFTYQIIEDYIKYLGNLRLKSLGLEPLWPEIKENPIPWVDNFKKINNTKTDFFQARPATYTKTSNLKW
ncbi:MAG: ribonucleotide-diphosphate reductase subunit beta, partial [Nanoarchaeota archaeon]